jgi:cytochrome c-type biogenesis protein CcmH
MRRTLIAALLALASLGATVREDPLDRATLAIAARLRCAVCQNESVADSHAPLAQDMRAIIREQLAAGRSEEEILAYFHARYGDYVLMRPPVRRTSAVLWAAPGIALVLAAAGATLYLRRRARAVP